MIRKIMCMKKIGNDKIEECKYIVNLLKNNEDPYDLEVIERKTIEQVEKINESKK